MENSVCVSNAAKYCNSENGPVTPVRLAINICLAIWRCSPLKQARNSILQDVAQKISCESDEKLNLHHPYFLH